MKIKLLSISFLLWSAVSCAMYEGPGSFFEPGVHVPGFGMGVPQQNYQPNPTELQFQCTAAEQTPVPHQRASETYQHSALPGISARQIPFPQKGPEAQLNETTQQPQGSAARQIPTPPKKPSIKQYAAFVTYNMKCSTQERLTPAKRTSEDHKHSTKKYTPCTQSWNTPTAPRMQASTHDAGADQFDEGLRFEICFGDYSYTEENHGESTLTKSTGMNEAQRPCSPAIDIPQRKQPFSEVLQATEIVACKPREGFCFPRVGIAGRNIDISTIPLAYREAVMSTLGLK